MKIPGITFSLKRAVGVTKVEQKIAEAIGTLSPDKGWSVRLVGSTESSDR